MRAAHSRGRVEVTEYGALPTFTGTLVDDSLSLDDAYREQGPSAIPAEIADPLHRTFRHAIIVGHIEHRPRPGNRQ